jgi:hypothetical protein
MDVSAIIGEELVAVEFVQDFLQLRFTAPLFTLYDWPHVLLPEFSVAYGVAVGDGGPYCGVIA